MEPLKLVPSSMENKLWSILFSVVCLQVKRTVEEANKIQMQLNPRDDGSRLA